MRIKDLKKLKPYRVIRDSSDGTFFCGEIIWLSENGEINSVQGAGWIDPSEVSEMTLDFEAEVASDFEVIRTSFREVCRKRNI